MNFNPTKVQILEKGEHFVGLYGDQGKHIEIELRFTSSGRVRLLVSKEAELLEDIELRLPTTNAMSTKIHATALIMSAAERHSEKIQ